MKLALSFALVVIFVGCSDPVSPPDDPTPRVTGIYYTTESSPTPIAVWGHPNVEGSTTGGSDVKFSVGFPYPNPADGSSVATFTIPRSANVKVWLTTANVDPSLVPSGVTAPLVPFRVIDTLMSGQYAAGIHTLSVDFVDRTRMPLPSGFYRIYVESSSSQYYRDVAICRATDSYPRSIIHFN